MKTAIKQVLLASMAVLGISFSPVQATVLFQDNFDTDNPTPVLNFVSLSNWTVNNGTVDYIRNGSFGISCVGGVGGCVDTDGSSGNGGRMLSIQNFTLLPSETYRFSLDISGNQRDGGSDQVSFGFDGLFTFNIASLSWNAPFTTQFFTVSGLSGVTKLFIDTTSNDNVGAVVDNASLECLTCGNPVNVPEPGILALIGLGILGLGIQRKRA